MRFGKAIVIGSAALLTASGLSAVAVADPASASVASATCGTSGPNLDDGGGKTTVGLNMQTGPYQDCPNVVWLPAGTQVWYWCYMPNDYNNTWTYGRAILNGHDYYGWVIDTKLDDNGSYAFC